MTLPLFPLNTVLFPGCVLDLQIFEARYLDMISRCMKQGTGFGVVCIVEGEEVGEAASRFAAIGCEALVRDFQQRTNGLLGIRVEGGRRFRVERAQVLPDQLTVADVQWLEEPPDCPLQAEHCRPSMPTSPHCMRRSPNIRWWRGWPWREWSPASSNWPINWPTCCRWSRRRSCNCFSSKIPRCV